MRFIAPESFNPPSSALEVLNLVVMSVNKVSPTGIRSAPSLRSSPYFSVEKRLLEAQLKAQISRYSSSWEGFMEEAYPSSPSINSMVGSKDERSIKHTLISSLTINFVCSRLALILKICREFNRLFTVWIVRLKSGGFIFMWLHLLVLRFEHILPLSHVR